MEELAYPLTVENVLVGLRPALEALRGKGELSGGDNGSELGYLLLIQERRRALLATSADTPITRRLAANMVLEDGIAELKHQDPDAADLLARYFQKGQSFQSIVNSRARGEKLSTLRRVCFERAIPLLAQVLYQQEMTLRQLRIEEARQTLPGLEHACFFGRNAALETLTEHLLAPDGYWLIALTGLGGIGKTTLALEAVRALLPRFHFVKIIWLTVGRPSLHGGHLPADFSSQDVIARLVRQLNLPHAITDTPAGQARAVRDVLKSARHLIVLDDVQTNVDIESLLTGLAELAQPSKFLFTSRAQPPLAAAVWTLPLPPLAPADALAYLHCRRDALNLETLAQAGESVLEQVYQTLGGHPQALQLFTQLAAHFAPTALLQTFATRAAVHIEDLYTSIYQRAWQTLTPEAQRILRAMTLVAKDGAAEEYVGALTGLERGPLWGALWQLSGLSLLNKRVDGQMVTYYTHHLTDAFTGSAWRAVGEDAAESERDAMLHAAVAYWRGQGHTLTLADFEAQHANVRALTHALLSRPGLWRLLAPLSESLFNFIEKSVFWREWLSLFLTMYAAAPADAFDERRLILSYISWLYRMSGDLDAAIDKQQDALHLAEESGRAQAIARENLNLCMVYRQRGAYDSARQHGRRALELFESIQADGRYLAPTLNALGLNAFHSAAFGEADGYFRRAIAFYEELDEQAALVRVLNNLCNCQRAIGDEAQAQEYIQRALELARRLGHRPDIEMVGISYANILLDRQAHAAAQAVMTDLHLDYNRAPVSLRNQGLMALLAGKVALAQGQLGAAETALHASQIIWQRLSDPRLLAQSLWLQARLGDSLGAADAAQAARRVADELAAQHADDFWMRWSQARYGVSPPSADGD